MTICSADSWIFYPSTGECPDHHPQKHCPLDPCLVNFVSPLMKSTKTGQANSSPSYLLPIPYPPVIEGLQSKRFSPLTKKNL